MLRATRTPPTAEPPDAMKRKPTEPTRQQVYLRPLGWMYGVPGGTAAAAGWARRLAGGFAYFSAIEILARAGKAGVDCSVMPLAGLDTVLATRADAAAIRATLARLKTPRADFAGLTLDRPRIMGILNVTPDSFSDGGRHLDAKAAIAHGAAMAEAGADIIDIGGESTRPGAKPVPVKEEIARILPVIRGLKGCGARLSVDTRRAETMRRALAAGAHIVNDVTALAGDPKSLGVVAASGAPAILMHMQGEPRTMQKAPAYADVALDVYDALAARVAAAEAAGIPRAALAIDPGIGFGKTAAHNFELLAALSLFHGLGCAIVLGASRKSFIGNASRGEPAGARLAGSLAAALAAFDQGVQIVRVHDVGETAQAVRLWREIRLAR
ncbi:MAG: dihydropteroate synthase [Rhodospirillales bacterium]|nr:dihydropteroate synthase [Rhodospirillales bacterium]